MDLFVERVDVWAATIDDKPGGLADVLSILRDAGANLQFIIARRAWNAVFAFTVLALFVALWQGHVLRRIAILEVLIAVVAVRVAWLLTEFLLSSRAGQERLLPFADELARRLRRLALMCRPRSVIGSLGFDGPRNASVREFCATLLSALGHG